MQENGEGQWGRVGHCIGLCVVLSFSRTSCYVNFSIKSLSNGSQVEKNVIIYFGLTQWDRPLSLDQILVSLGIHNMSFGPVFMEMISQVIHVHHDNSEK